MNEIKESQLKRITTLMNERGVDYNRAKEIVELVDSFDRDEIETKAEAKAPTYTKAETDYRNAKKLWEKFEAASLNEKNKMNIGEIKAAKDLIAEHEKENARKSFSAKGYDEFREMSLGEHIKAKRDYPEEYERKLETFGLKD